MTTKTDITQYWEWMEKELRANGDIEGLIGLKVTQRLIRKEAKVRPFSRLARICINEGAMSVSLRQKSARRERESK